MLCCPFGIYDTLFFRIVLQEDTNRMSANALAIVFAPCVLRCPDTTDPLQSVQDISKTTACVRHPLGSAVSCTRSPVLLTCWLWSCSLARRCVELIINEQMNKYRACLKDISSLEFAENKARSRLTHIRRSMVSPDVRHCLTANGRSLSSVELLVMLAGHRLSRQSCTGTFHTANRQITVISP